MQARERLHTGSLIDPHAMRARRGKLRHVSLEIADPLDVGWLLLGRSALVLRRIPVLAFMRSQDGCAKKQST